MLKTLKKESIRNILFSLTGILGFILVMYARSSIFISDTAWHIKVGEWILQNKSFPRYDTFSLLSSNLELNFMAHEWFFGIIAYLIDSLFSVNGLFIITTLFVFFSYIYSIIKSKAILPALLVASLFIFFQFSGSISCRPSTFSAILVVYLGYVFAFENNNVKRLIITSLGLLFLANFQGGFSTLVLIQFLWITICKSILNKKFDMFAFSTLSICFLVSCINPYGIYIHKYFVTTSNSITMYNTDYLPFSFSSIWQLGVVLVIVILSIVGYVKECSKEKDSKVKDKNNEKLLDLLIMFMYLAMVLYYKRTLDMFNYAFIIYMSKHLSWLFNKKIVNNICYIVVNLASLCLLCLVMSQEELPNKSTEDYIKQNIIGEEVYNNLKGQRINNTMGSGGYLIYVDEKPFIDTRTDVFIEEFGNPNLLELSAKSFYSDSLAYNLAQKYSLDYLLIEKNSLASQIFYASNLWEVSEESRYYILFEKVH